jgi:hypothetical protein
VSDVTPYLGSAFGGDDITFWGNLSGATLANTSVWVDSVECTVLGITEERIICKTGDKTTLAPSARRYIKITIGGIGVTLASNVEFYYGLNFSDPRTWGGEAPPQKHEVAYVPKG